MREQFFHDDDSTLRFRNSMLRGLSRENLAECAGLCRHASVNGRPRAMPSRQQPIRTCAERLMTVKVRGSARCAHCTGSSGTFSCGMATGFNPTTGSASFCGGGRQILAVIAFCWREPHADIYTARSPTNRAGGENATMPAGSRPVDRMSWNPSARQGVLSIRHRAVRRKEKLLCQP
jgi:hypothetical protein